MIEYETKCDERNDTFASDVQKRLSICGNLVASKAVYHSHCHVRFFFNKPTDAYKTPGQSQCPKMEATFNEICPWLEKENELLTFDEIRAKMIEISDEEKYTVKRIKQKLQDRYKDNIFFAKISGRKNVAYFRNEASWIISDQWYNNSRSNADDEAKLIIKTAAKLIKSDTSLFYFKKHAFKKHNAQNAKKLRNMEETQPG